MNDEIKFNFPQNDTSASSHQTDGQAVSGLRIANAGVFFNSQDIYSRALLKGFLRAVKPLGIPLAVMGFDKQKSKLPPLGIPFIACTSGDFSLFGKIKPGKVTAFMQKPFDILVDISLANTTKAEKITKGSAAKFKIGVNKESPYYHFLFKLPADEQENPQAFDKLLECLSKIIVTTR